MCARSINVEDPVLLEAKASELRVEIDRIAERIKRLDTSCLGTIDLEVTQADPGVRGDTASGGGTKPATLETGAVIQVPLFVEPGQRIRVDTRSGEYVARA